MQLIRYWIHGPKGSGKTELACRITGIPPHAHIDGHRSTLAGIRRALSQASVAVIENYRQDETLDQVLRTAALNQSVALGTVGNKRAITKIQFDIDVLVVISEQQPEDAALASRFFIIEMTGTNRLAPF